MTDDMRSVLTELLRLYDWRREVGATITDDQARQYGREKKAAWEAARRVLHEPKLSFGADNDALQTLNALLDPDISTPVILREVTIDSEAVSRSLQSAFDDYVAADPNDPWIQKVLATEENQPLWKLALSATYQVIKGPDRNSIETWHLIVKTYQLLAKNI